MKKSVLFNVIILFSPIVNAQILDLVWAKPMGDFSNVPQYISHAQSVTIDSKGNVYTVGSFGGTVDFDPGYGILNLSSKNLADCFISKLDKNGNFVWVKKIGEYGNNTIGVHRSIAQDNNDNVYITGTFTGTVDFDPGIAVFNLTQKSLFEDVFIVKLTTNGNFVWAKSFGGANNQSLPKISIAVDANQNVYAAGHFDGTADFDPGNNIFKLTSLGEADIFVSKLDENGDFVWAGRMGGFSNETAIALAIDQNANVYTTGTFEDLADFNPADGFLNLFSMKPKGVSDVFISKLDKNGNFVWAKQLGGEGNGKIHTTALTVDAVGNVYTTGRFWNTVDFDPSEVSFANMSTTSNQFSETFISKLNTNGDFVWAKELKISVTPTSITVDAIGNVYTTGCFWNTADFMPGRLIFNLTSKGSADIFISKLDEKGDFVFAKQMGGPGQDIANCIRLDSQGSIYTVGEFNGSADFDPEKEIFILSSPKKFSYITKYAQPAPEINIKQNNQDIASGGNQDFGTIKTFANKDLVFTLQNTGNESLVFTSVIVTGDFSLINLPLNFVAPGASINLTVRMNGTGITGNKIGKLTIKNNDFDESNYVINLTGTVEDILKGLSGERYLNTISGLTVYPNPTQEGWKINVNEDIVNCTYNLLDKLKRVVVHGKINTRNFYLNAEKLPAGVYFLHINNSKTPRAVKLIKE